MSDYSELLPNARPDCLARCAGLCRTLELYDKIDKAENLIYTVGMSDSPLDELLENYTEEDVDIDTTSFPDDLKETVNDSLRQLAGEGQQSVQRAKKTLLKQAAFQAMSCVDGPLTLRGKKGDVTHTVRLCTSPARPKDTNGHERVEHTTS